MLVLVLIGCRGKDTVDSAPGGPCPSLNVSPTSVEFDQVALGLSHVAEVSVTNLCIGEDELETIAAWGGGVSDAFSADLNIPVLAPGESHLLQVTFSSTGLDQHAASIQIVSTKESVVVELSGRATGDSDGDGYDNEMVGGEDCDDADPEIHPGAEELWYDGVDSDCDGGSDYDQDGDGEDAQEHGGEDCDDTDPDIPTEELWYDGVDSDCDGGSDYDQDGDGYDHAEHGGADCDDTDPDMYPGAPEVWYDGIDQDCGEDGDYDQDGDGADSAEYGGTDCDDTDPAIYYDSGETSQDLVDDDCDGLIDEDFIARGDVLIVEIMMTPLAVGDGVGEWFEVYNTSSMDVDLIGWEVRSWGNTGFIIDESLVVSSGSTVVLGVEDDASINGDLAVDYEFDRADVALNDSADTLFLYLGTDWITRVKWDESDGWELDDGASTNLDVDYRTTVGTGDAAYWCSSTTEFGDGDYGTPNATNDACTAKDYDGDGYSRDEGDCDDTDADTYPGAEEQWDGADNDCGGVVDDLVIDEVASGYLHGSAGQYLSFSGSLSLGDHDGDGTLDIVAGGEYVATYYGGGVFVADGTPYTGYAGPVYQNDYASVTDYYYNFSGQVDPDAGDVDGDGVHDLFVVGNDYYGYGVAGGLIYGGNLSGAMTLYGDADLTFSGTLSYEGGQRPLSSLDVDGDGGDDLLFADWDYYIYSVGYDHGFVHLFLSSGLSSGSGYDLMSDADVTWSGGDSQDHLGHSLGGGDVDGDGYDDVLMGAPYADQGQSESGSVYLVYGSASGGSSATADSSAGLTLYGAATENYLGWHAYSQVADFDDDGSADIAVSSTNEHTVYIFYGASSLSGKVRVDTADVTITSASQPEMFGHTLDSGDLDGDGLADLVVGAPDYDTYPPTANYYADEAGAVYLFYGADLTASMSESDANATFTGTDTADLFGQSVVVNDLDADGQDDLLIGAPRWGGSYGAVWIVESP